MFAIKLAARLLSPKTLKGSRPAPALGSNRWTSHFVSPAKEFS